MNTNAHPWEDCLQERKVESDLKDLLKTLVAFANSVRPNHVATIFIGEKDDGTAQGVKNPDNIQKTIKEEAEKIHPPIVWRSQVYEKDGKYCVKVEIEPSRNTPHFGGISWIRKGSCTVKAPDEVFQSLIDLRSSKVYELSKWISKEVSFEADHSNMPSDRIKPFGSLPITYTYSHRWDSIETGKLLFVNAFWATFEVVKSHDTSNFLKISEPLEKLLLSYDDENARLKLIVMY